MFPNRFQNLGGYYYPPPQHHGQAPHHGQTPGIIPIMYNVKGANTNQDFQQQSNIVMLPPSGSQQQSSTFSTSTTVHLCTKPPTDSKCHARNSNSCPDSGTTNACQSESTDNCSSYTKAQSVPYAAEEQEVVTFTTGQRLVNIFCVKCLIFQILQADNSSVLESNFIIFNCLHNKSILGFRSRFQGESNANHPVIT